MGKGVQSKSVVNPVSGDGEAFKFCQCCMPLRGQGLPSQRLRCWGGACLACTVWVTPLTAGGQGLATVASTAEDNSDSGSCRRVA